MKKNIGRKVILFSIIGAFLIGSIMKLTIEPADYKKSISKEIVKANELISNADMGNDNGQYSNNQVAILENQVAKSKEIVGKEVTALEEEKDELNKLKSSIKDFKKSKNKNCLSKSDIEKIRDNKEEITKEGKLDEETNIKWLIKGKAIENPASINLDVSSESAYEEKILDLLEDMNTNKILVSFRHNGQFPCFISVTISNVNKFQEGFLYIYDEEKNSLTYSTAVAISDDNFIFSVNEGGDYIITDKKIDRKELNAKTGQDKSEPENKKESSQKTTMDNEIKDSTSINIKTEITEEGNKDAKKEAPKGESTPPQVNNQSKPKANYCTVEIRCDTILNNMSKLRPGLDKYVPRNGIILDTTKVEIYEGENVFDVLKRLTRNKKIQMEFRNDPVYSGAYIEGINYLYEFDCGTESGWMYKVNGWFPNYGCSQYKLKDGDSISWVYTCNLGKDVGDQYYD